MTKIIYDRDELSLSMEGHALSNKYGEDIICAAESMLLMCLEKRLMDFGESVITTERKSPGRVYLQALPDDESEQLCRESFDTIYAGCALLAQYEPDYVSAREYMKEEEQWN